MARLLVIYRKPKDAAAFDKYYFETHIPLAKTIPGLRRFDVNRGPVVTPGAESDVHLIATLEWDDMAALQAGMASAEGQATSADARGFMGAGDSLMVFDTEVV